MQKKKKELGVIVPSCPKCGTFMDKVTGWVCSECGNKTRR